MDKLTEIVQRLPPLPEGAVTLQMLLQQTPPRYGMIVTKPFDLYNRLNKHVYQNVNTIFASKDAISGEYYVTRMTNMHEMILPHMSLPACVMVVTTVENSLPHTVSVASIPNKH
mgnify:CR=1 FL=1